MVIPRRNYNLFRTVDSLTEDNDDATPLLVLEGSCALIYRRMAIVEFVDPRKWIKYGSNNCNWG